MPGIVVSLQGDKELVTKLRALGNNISAEALGDAVMAGASVIADEAQARVPVRTGRLKRSLSPKLLEADAAHAVATVAPRDWTPTGGEGKYFYWRFLEYGTVNMAARPFLRPAFDERAEKAKSAIAERLRLEIERVVR